MSQINNLLSIESGPFKYEKKYHCYKKLNIFIDSPIIRHVPDNTISDTFRQAHYPGY